MCGVDQLLFSSRSTRQVCSPVLASNATRNDCSSLSHTMYSRRSCSTGDAAVPQPVREGNGPMGCDHTGVPSMSKAKTPTLPK
jgi:hypothetical protein